MFLLKEKVFDSFFSEEQIQGPKKYDFIESAILDNPLSFLNTKDDQVEFLRTALKYPKRIERIFRASEHEFRVPAFHKYCDNIPNTLTLVRNEFGKTMGGFTHYPWASSGGGVYDSGKKAFIFSLDMKEKFVP